MHSLIITKDLELSQKHPQSILKTFIWLVSSFFVSYVIIVMKSCEIFKACVLGLNYASFIFDSSLPQNPMGKLCLIKDHFWFKLKHFSYLKHVKLIKPMICIGNWLKAIVNCLENIFWRCWLYRMCHAFMTEDLTTDVLHSSFPKEHLCIRKLRKNINGQKKCSRLKKNPNGLKWFLFMSENRHNLWSADSISWSPLLKINHTHMQLKNTVFYWVSMA